MRGNRIFIILFPISLDLCMLRASKDSMASAVGFSDYRNIEKCVSKKNTSFTFVLTYSAFIYILRHKNYEIIFKVLPLNHNLNY